MAAGESRSSSFEGLLFEGNTKDKSWTLVCQKHVTMTIKPPVGVARCWSMVATQNEEKVWDGSVEQGLKHRVKDNFVQWQHKPGSDGAPLTFGLRLKTAELAQEFNSALGEALMASTAAKPTRRATDTVELQIVTPHGEPLFLPLSPTTTISQVMAIVAERRKLDPAHYNLTLPAEDPKGEGVACFGSMSVVRLKTHTLYLRRQPGAPEEARLNSVDQGIIQVELPRGERTSVKASGDVTLHELLEMVCRKRNLDVEDVKFDLPATEDSLAGKTLGQLKLTSLKLVSRIDSLSEKQAHSLETHTNTDSPKGGSRRHAPAPPSGPAQPRKVTASLMKEMSERKREPSPQAMPTEPPTDKVEHKPLPPPVAQKPKRKSGGDEDSGREETDGSPSIPRSTLDSLVMGVKVREAAERPEMGAITEGLKKAAASGGRYLSVKRRRQQSMEEPDGHTHSTPPLSHRRSREMEDIDIRSHTPTSLSQRTTQSLRRRPRGPAPGPPTLAAKEQRASTLNRHNVQSTREKKELSSRKPVRKAPVRPAPVKPTDPAKKKATPTEKLDDETKATPTKEPDNEAKDTPTEKLDNEAKVTPTKEAKATPTKKPDNEAKATPTEKLDNKAKPVSTDVLNNDVEAPPTEATDSETKATPTEDEPKATPTEAVANEVLANEVLAVLEERGEEKLNDEEADEEVDFSGYEFHPLTPPKTQSPPPQTPPTTPQPLPDSVVTATVVSQEGGGKTLIIKPSPASSRKAKIVFNLPPPPPPPLNISSGDNHEKIDNGVTNDVTMETTNSIAMETEGQPVNELSLISNEYTNLDEDDEEEDDESGAMAAAPENTSTVQEREKEECEAEVKAESGDPKPEENGVSSESQIPADEVIEKVMDLAPNGTAAILNCNNSNNNNSNDSENVELFPPPPLEFVAPSEKFVTSEPQQAFLMPAEPSFADESELTEDHDNDAVVLVSMTTQREVSGNGEEKKVIRGGESSASVESVGTQLAVLDSLVCSLQDSVSEEINLEEHVSISPSSSPLPFVPPPPSFFVDIPLPPPLPPPPPSQPVAPVLPPPSQPAAPVQPLPSQPAAPVLPPPSQPAAAVLSPPSQPAQPAAAVLPPPSQPAAPVQPLPSQPAAIVQPLPSQPAAPVQPQVKRSPVPAKPPPPVTVDSLSRTESSSPSPLPVSSAAEELATARVSHNTPSDTQFTPAVNLWHPASLTTGSQSVPQPGNLPSGEVQLQLQLLQQQLLQQQLMQLQQQFTQLQQSLQHSTSAPVAMAPPHMYAHPMVAMPMAGMPLMGPSVAMGTPGVIPAIRSVSPVPMSSSTPPLTSTPTALDKPHLTSDVIDQEKPRPHSVDSISSQPTVKHDVTAQLRAGALGQLESQFDRLMEDVREVEQSAVLKKVPFESATNGLEGEGSYVGMAAVLAGALRERRKHFTNDNRNTSSVDMDDSRVSEWDS